MAKIKLAGRKVCTRNRKVLPCCPNQGGPCCSIGNNRCSPTVTNGNINVVFALTANATATVAGYTTSDFSHFQIPSIASTANYTATYTVAGSYSPSSCVQGFGLDFFPGVSRTVFGTSVTPASSGNLVTGGSLNADHAFSDGASAGIGQITMNVVCSATINDTFSITFQYDPGYWVVSGGGTYANQTPFSFTASVDRLGNVTTAPGQPYSAGSTFNVTATPILAGTCVLGIDVSFSGNVRSASYPSDYPFTNCSGTVRLIANGVGGCSAPPPPPPDDFAVQGFIDLLKKP